MFKYWSRSAGASRPHGKVLPGWKPLGGAAAAAALAVTVAPGAAFATSAGAPRAAAPVNALLAGVTARSATDAWAVGDYTPTATNVSQALTEHWNGTSWAKVTNPALTDSLLNGVSADSATDAWAVGKYQSSTGQDQLIEHWNGTQWTQAATPTLPLGSQLTGVSAVSATDAWAVGYDSSSQASLLHWDGTAWTQVTIPTPAAGSFLYSVSAVSATSAWAVGDYVNSAGAEQAFLLHWDGTSWTQVATPATSYDLRGVSADSATDAWAVGYKTTGKTLVMHYNGSSWTQVTSPSPGTSEINFPMGVSALSRADAWAAGTYGGSGGTLKTLILRRSGTSWTKVTSPNPGKTAGNALYGVSADSATDAWTVGWYHTSTGAIKTLALRWNGTSWTKVSTPN